MHSSGEARVDGKIRQLCCKCARSDDDIPSICQSSFEPGEFADGSGSVRVGEQLEISDSPLHPMSDGSPFAPAFRHSMKLHGWSGAGKAFDDCGPPVGTAIVDDKYFVRAALVKKILGNLAEIREDAGSLIVSQDDDRDLDGIRVVPTKH